MSTTAATKRVSKFTEPEEGGKDFYYAQKQRRQEARFISHGELIYF